MGSNKAIDKIATADYQRDGNLIWRIQMDRNSQKEIKTVLGSVQRPI